MKGIKTGGRVKGTPNKPKPNKEVIAAVLGAYFSDTNKGISQFAADLATLTPADRLTHVKDYMPYVYPRLQAMQVDTRIEVDTTIEHKIINLI